MSTYMSTTISHQTYRSMRVHECTKEHWDEVKPHALKKAKDSFIFPMLWKDGTEEERADPFFYAIAFRYRSKYYTASWSHTLDEFDGISIVEGVQQITQVYYTKPHATQQAA